MNRRFGDELRAEIAASDIVPLIGVYDVFSATIAARHFDGITWGAAELSDRKRL